MSNADPYRQPAPQPPAFPPLPYGAPPAQPAWPAPPAAAYPPPAPLAIRQQPAGAYYGGQQPAAMPPMPGPDSAGECRCRAADVGPGDAGATARAQTRSASDAAACAACRRGRARPLPHPVPAPLPAKPAANRPQPLPARPVPLPAKPAGDAPLVQTGRAGRGRESQGSPRQKAVKTAPPWLVSMVIHMLLIIGLALAYFTIPGANQVQSRDRVCRGTRRASARRHASIA